jgi:hypothetical protein
LGGGGFLEFLQDSCKGVENTSSRTKRELEKFDEAKKNKKKV